MSKSKSWRLSYILVEANPSKIDKYKSKNEALVSEVIALFNFHSAGQI